MSGEKEGYLKVDVVGVYPVVFEAGGAGFVMLLEAPEWKGKVLPIYIGVSEGIAIQNALSGVRMERPMTHDLIVSILDTLGVSVERVTIDALLNNSVYTATIVLRRGTDQKAERIFIDARPSDSVAIALRAGAPVYVAAHLEKLTRTLEELGFREENE
ncbi:bifunctional nuclease family protein [Infirmifilum lucidum]|uniref:Bifunctional nuclease family protein n=1 Tax=Infirmifilum lucidum TaxID=2776706 RepID=A0A7L9FFE5_9CREN|nr:bifunctional nuclease family protein [Infirmifilum lucidum]QOJ78500.1 bifunctional nuclease family protein [Infirmifilum lucidum]